ncbi:hypothetical protein TUMSATVNIG1_27740 [Vibrio nigripulchritudo]|uniref:hypothetical protein n=1 Tax=Vibrio nigripulchritudo TaxID=28173 RepID=UPI00190CAED4|nr:hypothetical protein [Vibrio nigripulchritudo]BCL70809.1 hypothetical protein VNTUMSATTG_27460 [Vibrio nigripulchritudo]BDU32165.1 hypothetical protein TUMSATVNIG1_27740 [Vibrio nigripulchritudo]
MRIGKYIIQRGDAISEATKELQTDKAAIDALSTLNLSDIGQCRSDGKLIPPVSEKINENDKEVPQELPDDKLVAAQCERPEFIDALYVLENPTTKKSQYILLDKNAKECVVSEAKKCADKIKGTREETVKGLASLGLLEPFNVLSHEYFLNGGERSALRRANIEKILLEKSLSDIEIIRIPYDDATIGLTGIDDGLQIIKERYDKDQEFIKDFFGDSDTAMAVGYSGAAFVNRKDKVYSVEVTTLNALRRLQKKAIGQLESHIEDLKDNAIETAEKTEISNRKIKYKFSRHQYYTFDYHEDMDKWLEELSSWRYRSGIIDNLNKDEITKSTTVLDLDDAFRFYREFISVAKILKNKHPKQDVEDFLRDYRNIVYRAFFPILYKLNKLNFVFKEQCLNGNDLFNGKDEVSFLVEKLCKDKISVKEIIILLEKINIKTLGYYPAYVLRISILKEVSYRIGAFNDFVEGNEEFSKYINSIVTYSEKASKRLKELKHKVIRGVRKDLDHSIFLGPNDLKEDTSKKYSPYPIVFDEKKWKPKNLDKVIIAKRAEEMIHIVECSLASDPEKRIYILSNNPVLSESASKNKFCSKLISFSSYSHVAGDGAIGKVPENLLKQIAKNREYKFAEWKFMESNAYIGDDDWVKSIPFPWKTEKTDLFGIKGELNTSGEAQFMRYVSEASVGVTQGNFNKDHILANADIKVGYDLATAQNSFDFFIPSKTEFLELEIPYIKKVEKSDGTISVVNEIKKLGGAQLLISGKVFGAIAASIQIANGIYIGNTNERGLGVRGMVDKEDDYDDYAVTEVGNSNNDGNSKFAAGAAVSAKAFAGIEVGGSVKANFLWKPNNSKKVLNLFNIGVGARLTFGYGYEFMLHVTLHSGRLIFVTNVQATKAVGIGGKIASEINIEAADEFFSALLDVMQEPGFSKFRFFAEPLDGELDTFAVFNIVITVAMAYGLTIAQVLLLPYKMILSMEKVATEKDTASFVANFILSEDNQMKNGGWIKNMPAETLAKVLTVLINYTPIPDIAIFDYQKENRDKIARRNQNQRFAINKILEWLGGENPDLQQIRRFENTMQRIGLSEPTKLDDKEKWQRYANNVMSVMNYFKQGQRDYYELENGNNTNGDYMDIAGNQFDLVKFYLNELTKLNNIMEKPKYNGRSGPSVKMEYISAKKNNINELRSIGYKNVKWF